MPKTKKTVRMVKGLSVVNPLPDAVPVWEKTGYKVAPDEAPKGDKTDAQTED